MPCDCKTKQQLYELGLKYGQGNLTRKQIIRRGLKTTLLSILGVILVILLSPAIVLYVLYKGIFGKDKIIDFKKILNLKKNVREEQNIQAED